MCAQINVGSVVQKSYMRFLGTFSGSVIAALTLYLAGNNIIADALVISLSALVFSYIATGQKSYNDAGTLGAVTVVIILIAKDPTPLTALERFIEISVGILIAALISQFVLPIHAREHLRETQAVTIRKLRAFYLATLFISQSEEESEGYQTLDEDIAQSLSKQRKLAVDAAREPLGAKFNISQFKQLLQSEKEILRCIAAMHLAYKVSPDSKKLFSNMELVKNFHDAVSEAFEKIAAAIETNTMKTITVPDIDLLKANIFSQVEHVSANERVYLDAFLFSAEILVKQLKKLIEFV
jgi:uncharacterized membrane protein YccC